MFQVNKHDPKSKTKDVAVHKLFTEIAPRFSDRNGGYTRVLRTRVRDGDKAQMAIIEFVSEEVKAKETGRKKRRVKKSAATETKKKAGAVGEEAQVAKSEEATPEVADSTETKKVDDSTETKKVDAPVADESSESSEKK